jgi:hypothetical protein
MFDSRHVLGPLHDSEHAESLVKVPCNSLKQYAHNGLVAGLRAGNVWRFWTSGIGHCPPRAVNSEQLSATRGLDSRKPAFEWTIALLARRILPSSHFTGSQNSRH